MFAIGETVGLAEWIIDEWIIDDTCLVLPDFEKCGRTDGHMYGRICVKLRAISGRPIGSIFAVVNVLLKVIRTH